MRRAEPALVKLGGGMFGQDLRADLRVGVVEAQLVVALGLQLFGTDAIKCRVGGQAAHAIEARRIVGTVIQAA
jgi:hypothetical protein